MLVLNGTTGVDKVQDGSITSAKIANGSIAFIDMLSTEWSNRNTANGYQKLPSGLIIQWGTTAPSAGGAQFTITLPIAFPTACQFAMAECTVYTAVGEANNAITSKTTTTLLGNGGGGTTQPYNWFAIGY